MSKPPDSLPGLAYAPKWARDAAIAERLDAAEQNRVSQRNEGVSFRPVTPEARSPDDAWPTEWSPAPRSLDPVILPPPPSRSLLRVRFAIVGGLAISAAAGAMTTLFVMGKLPSWGLVAKGDRLGSTSFETRFIGQNARASNLDLFAYASQLASINIARQRENHEVHSAEPLAGADQASSRTTDGAAPTAPASEEPRLAEPLRGSTADQSPSSATEGPSAPAPANEEPRFAEPLRGATVEHVTEPTSPSPRALNPDEIAAFLKRGQELAASGDIAAARVLLLRVAEAREPNAALALAATFDPIILGQTRAYGIVPDVPSARYWYEKAKEFGSDEAPPRLEMLAGREK